MTKCLSNIIIIATPVYPRDLRSGSDDLWSQNDARKPFKKPCMLVYANTTESDWTCVLFTFNVHTATRKHVLSQKAHDSQTTDLWPIVVKSQ